MNPERCEDCATPATPNDHSDPHRVQDWGGVLLCLYCAEIRGIANHTCCSEYETDGDDHSVPEDD